MSEAKLTVTKYSDDLWIFNESGGANVDAYLVLGREKAALIDSLMSVPKLWDEIRKITDLPVELIVTHGHLDHIGIATLELMDKGCPVYMDKKDLDMAEASHKTELSSIIDITDGMVFDLGGVKLEAISLGGHTPGSIVLLDRENERLFTGDAIGSGDFWMQLPCCLSLQELAENIENLIEKLQNTEGVILHPGHRHQSPPQMDEQYIFDVLDCTRGIIDGSIKGKTLTMDFHGGQLDFCETSYGLVRGYCYDPKNLTK